MTQHTIDFDSPRLSGETFSREFDGERLAGQLSRVFHLMSDSEWRTLSDISLAVGGSEAGVSARLRDLRKERFGGFTVLRRRKGEPRDGLWEYRLVVGEPRG